MLKRKSILSWARPLWGCVMNKLQTRSLLLDVSDNIQLWQWLESKELELVFNVGLGYKRSYQSDDLGRFASMLVKHGRFADHSTALEAINASLVS